MKTKTYNVMVSEKVIWDLEVKATSHKAAQELAIFKVSHNEYNHFPMFDRIQYGIFGSYIVPENNDGD